MLSVTRTTFALVFAIALLMVLAGCGGGSGGGALTVPPAPPPPSGGTVSVEPTFTSLSFSQPVAMLQAPNDNDFWYVVERVGTIRRFANDPATTTTTLFADLSGLINSGPQEAGLLGMAFDPDFASNRHVFLSYTTTGAPLISRIVRYTANAGGTALDIMSGVEVLSVPQNGTNHNGGQVSFGPDGLLYAAFGDGGGGGDPGNNGQDPNNLRGTILRIDVQPDASYQIPASNPFAGNPLCRGGDSTVGCPEIFAWGLRNPWRFSFDRVGGALLVGDVGQGALEEIDRVVAGANYGWNIREGDTCFNASSCATAGLTDPIHVYGRSDGQSVTGGFVYRGQGAPSLTGRYVFGDFASGRVWTIDSAVQTPGPADLVEETGLSIASFAEGNDGEVFVVDFGGALYAIEEN